jgi:hypothetical protein
MSNTPTEAHLELAKTALFSRDAAGRLLTAPMAAQLIADSEAVACDQLRAEVERLKKSCEFADFQRQQARAERAESELANERDKVRVLRDAMKYLRNDDNYIDPQFDPCALASKAFEVTRDAK